MLSSPSPLKNTAANAPIKELGGGGGHEVDEQREGRRWSNRSEQEKSDGGSDGEIPSLSVS